jgi:ribosomal protein S18 acetylase RimI-like enzyme
VTSAVEIRPATRDDLGAIARIQLDSREAPAWEPLSYLGYDCRVACTVGCRHATGGDHVAGFMVSRQVSPPGIENGEREILSLAVDPADRRQGIGRALVEAELASASKGTTWFLEVRESNIAAVSLYAAMGFTASGRRPGYYHDPAEAAIVMRFFS